MFSNNQKETKMKLFMSIAVLVLLSLACSVDTSSLDTPDSAQTAGSGPAGAVGADSGAVAGGTAGTMGAPDAGTPSNDTGSPVVGAGGHPGPDASGAAGTPVVTPTAGSSGMAGMAGTMDTAGQPGTAGAAGAVGAGGMAGMTTGGTGGAATSTPFTIQYKCSSPANPTCRAAGNVFIWYTIRITVPAGTTVDLEQYHIVYWFSDIFATGFSPQCTSLVPCSVEVHSYMPNNVGQALPVPPTATRYQEITLHGLHGSFSGGATGNSIDISVQMSQLGNDSTNQADDYSFDYSAIDFKNNLKIAAYISPAIGTTGNSPVVGMQP